MTKEDGLIIVRILGLVESENAAPLFNGIARGMRVFQEYRLLQQNTQFRAPFTR